MELLRKLAIVAGMATALAAGTVASASASTVNLLSNGDFSANSPSNPNIPADWTVTDPSGSTGWSGAEMVIFGAPFQDGYLTQSVATTIGKSYTLTFDLMRDQVGAFGNDHFAAGIDLQGADPITLFNHLDADGPLDFVTYSVVFSALSSMTDIGFAAVEHNGFWWLDNVSLTANDVTVAATPLPGSSILFMSGLGVAGFASWRSKRGRFSRSIAA